MLKELLETRRGQTSLKLVMVEVAKNLYPDIDFSQPDTWCIHHVDGNDKNNDMTNISLMKRGKHTSLHSAIRYKKLEKIKERANELLDSYQHQLDPRVYKLAKDELKNDEKETKKKVTPELEEAKKTTVKKKVVKKRKSED